MSNIRSLFEGMKKKFNKEYIKTVVLPKVPKFIPSIFLLLLFIILLSTTRTFTFKHVIVMTTVLIFSIAVPIIKNHTNKIVVKLFSVAVFLASPILLFYTVEAFMNNNFGKTPWLDHIVIMNLAFYYLLEILIFTITTRSDIAVAVTAIVPSVLGIANYVCLQTRDLPLYPWDVLSANTALSVVGNYDLHFSAVFKLCIFCIIAVILIASMLNFRLKFKISWVGIFPALAAIVLMTGYVANINSIFKTEENAVKEGYYPYLFSASYLYRYNGTPITFIYTLKYLNLSAPKGYDVDELKALYEQYKEASERDAEEKKDKVKPNIIVIMNESFSDPSVLGKFTTNEPYLPFIESLKNNDRVTMGSTIVSVKGGNTPNSEFEFLTGTSMAFLPTESIPYQQFIEGNFYSLVSQLNDSGYRTVGMHNYYKSGWERDEIYGYLGFDESYFLEDMRPIPPEDMIRSYMSDKAMYDRIIAQYENRTDDAPLFVFGVTMQNHGGYDDKKNGSFVPSIKAELEGQGEMTKPEYDTTFLNNYLSLIKESDDAFKYFIDYFENKSEPTVIIMFGDHQPADNVVSSLLESNGIVIDNSDPAQRILRYQTPYIVWSNYDIESDAKLPEALSLNYFGGYVMDICGIPMTPFQLWQRDLIKRYPIVNAFCYLDENGAYNTVAGIDKIDGLNLLGRIQYNLIFDRKNTVSELFRTAVTE